MRYTAQNGVPSALTHCRCIQDASPSPVSSLQLRGSLRLFFGRFAPRPRRGGTEFEKEEKSGHGTCTQDFQGNLASGWSTIDTAWGPAGPIADLYTVGTASQCYGGE